jgi:hypothetical protein
MADHATSLAAMGHVSVKVHGITLGRPGCGSNKAKTAAIRPPGIVSRWRASAPQRPPLEPRVRLSARRPKHPCNTSLPSSAPTPRGGAPCATPIASPTASPLCARASPPSPMSQRARPGAGASASPASPTSPSATPGRRRCQASSPRRLVRLQGQRTGRARRHHGTALRARGHRAHQWRLRRDRADADALRQPGRGDHPPAARLVLLRGAGAYQRRAAPSAAPPPPQRAPRGGPALCGSRSPRATRVAAAMCTVPCAAQGPARPRDGAVHTSGPGASAGQSGGAAARPTPSAPARRGG